MGCVGGKQPEPPPSPPPLPPPRAPPPPPSPATYLKHLASFEELKDQHREPKNRLFSKGSGYGSFHGSRARSPSSLAVDDIDDDRAMRLGRELRALSSVDEGVESEAVSGWLYTHPALPFPYNRWGSNGSDRVRDPSLSPSPRKHRATTTALALQQNSNSSRQKRATAGLRPFAQMYNWSSRTAQQHPKQSMHDQPDLPRVLPHAASSPSVFRQKHGSVFAESPMHYTQNPMSRRRDDVSRSPVIPEEGDDNPAEETIWDEEEETVWDEAEEGLKLNEA